MTNANEGRPSRAPIHFSSKEEFEARPNYVPALRCESDDLDYIVGKYGFSKHKQLQCGLNGCNSWHQHGFVIATKSGEETHCGQHCGKREFGVPWDDVHAEFERQAQADARKQLVASLLQDRTELLRLASEMSAEVSAACSKIESIYDELRKEPLLARQFESALSSEGRILAEVKVDRQIAEALGQRGRNANVTAIGRILGRMAVEKYESIGHTLEWGVLRPLENLTEESIEAMTDERITATAKSIHSMRLDLALATEFVTASRQFLSPGNLIELQKLKEVLPSRARTQRLERIFARLPALFGG